MVYYIQKKNKSDANIHSASDSLLENCTLLCPLSAEHTQGSTSLTHHLTPCLPPGSKSLPSHSHYPPGRTHHQEIIFHAKLTRPTHRDFPLTPRHSSSEKGHKMREWREGARERGGEDLPLEFLLYGRVKDEWVPNESKMNDSL